MSVIGIDQYNHYEKEARTYLPNRFIEAFRPETFEKFGYPTVVFEETEVSKYLDCMHDGRLKLYYDKFPPTINEFEVIRELVQDIYKFSQKVFNKGILVKAPMLSANYTCRYIKMAQKIYGGVPTIFEIGGGCGVLGAMLHKLGYEYISTDITQAFYLTQNKLWESLFPGQVNELLSRASTKDIGWTKGSILHIPYWNMWNIRNHSLDADIIVADHCLAEMNPRSLMFYLNYAKKILKRSEYKLLVTGSLGSTINNTKSDTLRIIRNMGWDIIHSCRDIMVFRLKLKEVNHTKGNSAINNHKTNLLESISRYPFMNNIISRYFVKKDKKALKRYLKNTNYDFEEQESKLGNDRLDWNAMYTFFCSFCDDIDSPDESFIHYCGLERL